MDLTPGVLTTCDISYLGVGKLYIIKKRSHTLSYWNGVNLKRPLMGRWKPYLVDSDRSTVKDTTDGPLLRFTEGDASLVQMMVEFFMGLRQS